MTSKMFKTVIEDIKENLTVTPYDNKGSCWILKDFYCQVTMLRELGVNTKHLSEIRVYTSNTKHQRYWVHVDQVKTTLYSMRKTSDFS